MTKYKVTGQRQGQKLVLVVEASSMARILFLVKALKLTNSLITKGA